MLAGLGLSVGAVVWAAAAAVGLGLLSQLAWLQDVLRWVGGAYLVYLGIQKLCRTEQGPVSLHATTRWQAFRAGVLLNLANPYCLLFFAGTFAAMLPMDSPYWFRAAAVAIVLVDALLWYSMLAFLFSLPAVRSVYAKAHKWLNWVTGGLLALFGVRMVLSTR